MKRNLLTSLAIILFSLLSYAATAQASAPYFTAGATQSLSVCANSSASSLNTILAVIDSNTGETETWGAISTPSHGTLVASYTTTSTGGTLTPTGLTYTPATGFSGADTFSVGVSDGTYADTIIIYVTVRPLPSAGTISGASSVCVGATTTLTSSSAGGSWSSSNATANISSAGLVTGVSAGLDTITYFVVNSCGVDYATASITINPLPLAGTILGPSSLCVGATTIVADTVSGGTWHLTNTNASLSGDSVTGTTAGLDTVTYTVTNSCGSSTALHPITINPLPVAGTITGATVVCEGATITDTTTGTGGSWTATNGNASVTSAGIITGNTAGLDTVIYTVTNSCGTVSASRIITINPLPVAGTLSGASAVCVGAAITLSASVFGGTWSASNASATLTDSIATGATSGIDTISYSITNSCGTRAATHIVTVSAAPHAGPITGLDRVCLGSSIVLTAPASTMWLAVNGTVTVSGDTVTGVAFGRDTILNIVTNICGSDTAYHYVHVDTAAPHVSAITGPFIVCAHDTIRVTDSIAGGVWSVTNARAAINTTGLVRGNTGGVDTVVYTARNGCGTATAYYPVTINPLPVVGPITGYDSVCISSQITLHDAVPGGTWVSDNTAFADVDTGGKVSGFLHGSVNIYYIVSNSCGTDSAVKQVNINQPAQPILGSPDLCLGATSILLDPTPNGAWSTTFPTGYLVVGPLVGGTVIGVTVGTATVTYTVHNACGTSVSTFNVTVSNCAAGVTNTVKNNAQGISIYPNPNNGVFYINLQYATNEMADVVITNVLGTEVKRFSVPTNKPTDIQASLPAGVYILSATLNNDKYTTRVVVEK